MGCSGSSNRKLSLREKNFHKKAIILIQKFSVLRNDIASVQHLIFEHFSISHILIPLATTAVSPAMTSIPNNGLCSIPRETIPPPLLPGVVNADGEGREKNISSTGNLIEEKILATLDFGSLVSIASYLQNLKEVELGYFRTAYESTIRRMESSLTFICVCKGFKEKLEEQIKLLEEVHCSADILNKCVRAFKDELSSHQPISSPLFWLPSLVINAKALLGFV